MGGKKSDNGEMVRMQQQQADEARAKEVARQGRIDQGLAAIRGAFEGSPVMGSRAGSFDWASAAGGGAGTAALPVGYSWVRGPSTTTAAATRAPNYVDHTMAGSNAARSSMSSGVSSMNRNGASSYNPGLNYGTVAAGGGTTTTPGAWMVRGPDGRLYKAGENIGYTQEYDTGQRRGGFDNSFYDKFKQSILDYYMPQVEDQYGQAKDQTTYALARAGTLQSRAAIDEAARLKKENDLNRANVVTQADTGAAGLRQRVAQERAKAEATLYATENPEVAANQALAAVRDASVAQPELSPLGKIFQTALIGGANAYTGARNQYLTNEYNKKRAQTQVVA